MNPYNHNKDEYFSCDCHQGHSGHHFGEDLRCERGCGTLWETHQKGPVDCVGKQRTMKDRGARNKGWFLKGVPLTQPRVALTSPLEAIAQTAAETALEEAHV